MDQGLGCGVVDDFSGAVRTARNGGTAPMLRISAKEAATIKISKIANWDRRRLDIWCQRRFNRVVMVMERKESSECFLSAEGRVLRYEGLGLRRRLVIWNFGD